MTDAEEDTPILNQGYQEIRMEVNRYGWAPNKFVLKRGVPVKWIIDGKEINRCNNAINVPAYGLEFDIKPGIQVMLPIPFAENEKHIEPSEVTVLAFHFYAVLIVYFPFQRPFLHLFHYSYEIFTGFCKRIFCFYGKRRDINPSLDYSFPF